MGGSAYPEKCQEIIQNHFHNTQDGTFRGETGEQVNNYEKRKTKIAWIEPGTEVFDTLYGYIMSANEQNWKYDLSGMEHVQIGMYQDNGHYDWHCDMDDICDEGYQRKLSLSLQLSSESDYEGGELIMSGLDNRKYTANKKQGSIVVFPATLPHKVNPVTSGIRYSAVAWMRGPAFR